MYCATTATQVGLRSPFTVWVIGWAEVGLGPGCLRTPGQGHAASCCLSVRQGPGGGAVRAVQTVNMSSQVCVDSVPGDEGKPWHASSKQYAVSSKQARNRGAQLLYLKRYRPTSHQTWWVGTPAYNNQTRIRLEPPRQLPSVVTLMLKTAALTLGQTTGQDRANPA